MTKAEFFKIIKHLPSEAKIFITDSDFTYEKELEYLEIRVSKNDDEVCYKIII